MTAQCSSTLSTPAFHDGVQFAWCIWQVLRKLGFNADDIFAGVVTGDFMGHICHVVRVELRTQDKEFGIHLVPWTGDTEIFREQWLRLCEKLNRDELTDAELRGWMHRYLPKLDIESLAEVLRKKGIVVPAKAAHQNSVHN